MLRTKIRVYVALQAHCGTPLSGGGPGGVRWVRTWHQLYALAVLFLVLFLAIEAEVTGVRSQV